MKKIKTIALIAPSGNIKDFKDIENKIKILEKKFIVKKFYNEKTSNGYLSDTDENRIKYLQNAFLDEEVDLVLSVRGGFGVLKIVDKINYALIKNCGKIYVGSSDATILLMALSKKTNIKCYHVLMMTNGFVENLDKNIDIIENNKLSINLETIKKGSCQGKLWGGNLSSIVSVLSGKQYLPDEDIVLFLEDLNEPLYKIDKTIQEIYRCEKLRKKIKGIVFGDFYLEEDEINPLLKEYSKIFNVPTAKTKDITHKINNITIPYGINVSFHF